MMKAVGFGKAEKLKSTKAIDALFAGGRTLSAAPVRVKYAFVPHTEARPPVQVGVSVSKRSFKRATDRNRIKRQLREAYRLQKAPLVQLVTEKPIHLNLFFIYTGSTLPQYATLATAVGACLQQLQLKTSTYESAR